MNQRVRRLRKSPVAEGFEHVTKAGEKTAKADQLFEAVKNAKGLQYMMFETFYFHPGLWPMRQLYQAGCFGKHVYSEGHYEHYLDEKEPMPSYLGWRNGPPPLWDATHSMAYYTGVTGGTFTHLSCQDRVGTWYWLQPGSNKFNNTFATEYAPFRTSDGGMSRMSCSADTAGHEGVKGRLRGERGSFEGSHGDGKNWGTFDDKLYGVTGNQALPDLNRPPLPPTVDPGGPGGAEGHLMNDFIIAILQDRTPMCNVAEALNMTVAGIVASESAQRKWRAVEGSPVHDAGLTTVSLPGNIMRVVYSRWGTAATCIAIGWS